MGVRKSSPFGLSLNVESDLLPHFSLTQPLRLVVPGPLGTPEWHEAVAQARHHAGPKAAGPVRDLDYDKIYRDIERWEGVVKHMYLDTHDPPLVTVGTGNMLPSVAAAQALPFINTKTKKPATDDEIAATFHAVAAMTGGLPARRYELKPNLEISEEKAKGLAISRLKKDFIPGLKKWSKAFDHFPLPAREALIDMAYNGGVGRPEKVVNGKRHKATGLYKFKHLMVAVAAADWHAAAKACHSSSSRPDRNQWRKDLFAAAARLAAKSEATH